MAILHRWTTGENRIARKNLLCLVESNWKQCQMITFTSRYGLRGIFGNQSATFVTPLTACYFRLPEHASPLITFMERLNVMNKAVSFIHRGQKSFIQSREKLDSSINSKLSSLAFQNSSKRSPFLLWCYYRRTPDTDIELLLKLINN
jgi:hypothetical protein